MQNTFYWILQSLAFILLATMLFVVCREFQSILAVARQTWKEAVRKKTLWLVMIFAVVLIGATTFIQAAGTELSREERQIRIMLETSFRAMGLLSTITAIFLTSLSLPTDIRDRHIFTLLSKPVSRWGLMVGKITGFCMVIFAMLVMMGLFLIIFLRASTSDVSPEVKARMLGARAIIPPASTTMLGTRKAVTRKDRVELPIKRDLLLDSMYLYEIETDKVPMERDGLPAQLKFFHFKDSLNRPLYTKEELKGPCFTVAELIEPNSMHVENLQLQVDPESGKSQVFYIPEEFLATKSVAVRIVHLQPAIKQRRKLTTVYGGETYRLMFRNLTRAETTIQLDPAVAVRGDEIIKTILPEPALKQDQWLTLQMKFRVFDKENYLGGSRKGIFDLSYRWPDEKEPRGRVLLKLRDNRMAFVNLPVSAISDLGELQIDISNRPGSPWRLGLEHKRYELSLLSSPNSFDLNILKGVIMLSFQVILLVVVAVSLSTFLSWPVTALGALFVYFCGSIASALGEIIQGMKTGALRQGHTHGAGPPPPPTWLDEFLRAVVTFLHQIMPDLDKFSPLSMIGRGYAVSLPRLFASFAYMSIFATIVLSVGWLVFRKRSVD